MADESPMVKMLRRAARDVALDIAAGRGVDRLASSLERALLLAGRDAGAGERDERTRDLDALAEERDAARAEVERLTIANASQQDEIHSHIRNAIIAERRAKHAEVELEKTRAMIDELREQLAAPTVHGAAVEAWLGLSDDVRAANIKWLRAPPVTDVASIIADVLDSLSMQPPEPDGDERAGVPTEAADEVERLRARVVELANEVQRHKNGAAMDARVSAGRERKIRELESELAQRPVLDPEKVAAWKRSPDPRELVGVLRRYPRTVSQDAAADILESLL